MKLSVQILFAFAVVIVLSVADSYTHYMLSQKVQRNSRFLSRSEAIIRNSNKTHKDIIDMQSAFRGYLLTEDSTFLEPYRFGIKNVPQLLTEQRRLVTGNALQQSILDSIVTMHSQWVNYSSTLIKTRQKQPESYQAVFDNSLRKKFGKNINDEIARKFVRFDRIEYRVRKYHSAALLESIANTNFMSVIFLSLTIFIGVISTIYIIRLITKRIATMVRLAEHISRGHFTYVEDNRNDELTGLSQSLNIMSRKLDKNIRELENRNAELNKFAYVVSHDLKAPIRGIHNVIQWIEEDFGKQITPELKKYLLIIPQRTQRMEALINGLLDYARISLKTPPEQIDMNALVGEIADLLVPRHFKIHIDRLPELFTERIKLEQVFANLISNAVKYTPQGDAAIAITCNETPSHYEFSVKDNGIGIAPEYHQKIFEIFQTLREKDEKESTGVGLSIVKKILDDRHEHITLNSQPGEGAAFVFTWKKNNTNEKTHDSTDRG